MSNTDTTEVSESKELVVVETIKPEELFKAPAKAGDQTPVDILIDNLEKTVRAAASLLTVKTTKHRNAIKSLAYKVATSKTALDEMGKDYVIDLKRAAGAVDAERRKVRERLDALRDEVKAPVEAYEADVKRCIEALDHLRSLAGFIGSCSTALIDEMLGEVAAYKAPYVWGEFQEAADELIEQATNHLTGRRIIEERNQQDREELEQLRREKAAREEAERLAREEAERKRVEEERAAAQAKREEEIALAAAKRGRERAEAAAAEAAREAERAAVELARRQQEAIEEANARAAKAEADRLALAAAVEADRLAAERAAEVERLARDEAIRAAQAKAEADAAAAVEAERKRVEEARRREAEETAAREADQKHRDTIIAEIIADLQDQASIGFHIARDVANVIATGSIRNVKVDF